MRFSLNGPTLPHYTPYKVLRGWNSIDATLFLLFTPTRNRPVNTRLSFLSSLPNFLVLPFLLLSVLVCDSIFELVEGNREYYGR